MSVKEKLIKNSTFLFLRMLLVTLMSLIVVKLLVSKLGEIDYGIYTLIWGISLIFFFAGDSLSSSCQRFFSEAKASEDKKEINNLWNLYLRIFLILGIIIYVLIETVGIWVLNNQLNIPLSRIAGANRLLHYLAIAITLKTFSSLFLAILYSNEKFKFYATLSVLEAILKLVLIMNLDYFFDNKLASLGFIMMILQTLFLTFISVYCFFSLEDCRLTFKKTFSFKRHLLSYAIWNASASLSLILRNHGLNIILNILIGPVANAAYAISLQINTLLSGLINSVYNSLKPRIHKTYHSDKIYAEKLVLRSSKYLYFLLLIISLPIFIETEFIFSIWLETSPDFAIGFTRLVIINFLINVFFYPITGIIQANGEIKKYTILIGLLLLFNLPISWILLNLNYHPYTIFISSIFLSLVSFYPRFKILRNISDIRSRLYIKEVITPCLYGLFYSLITPFIINQLMEGGLYKLLINSSLSVGISVFMIYNFCLNQSEKRFLIEAISFKNSKK